MWTDIREGLRWLREHRLRRTLALLLAAMNGTTMVGMSIFTLYVYGEGSILGLDAIGYGLLLLPAAGGVCSAASPPNAWSTGWVAGPHCG